MNNRFTLSQQILTVFNYYNIYIKFYKTVLAQCIHFANIYVFYTDLSVNLVWG